MAVSRFGVSLDEELLKALDQYVKENNFANRSQAIRFLVEKNMVETKWKCDNEVAGAITLVYQARKKDLRAQIQDLQADHTELILSSQIHHLNAENCLEIVVVQGPSFQLTELADKFISLKGIQHGKLMMSKVE